MKSKNLIWVIALGFALFLTSDFRAPNYVGGIAAAEAQVTSGSWTTLTVSPTLFNAIKTEMVETIFLNPELTRAQTQFVTGYCRVTNKCGTQLKSPEGATQLNTDIKAVLDSFGQPSPGDFFGGGTGKCCNKTCCGERPDGSCWVWCCDGHDC